MLDMSGVPRPGAASCQRRLHPASCRMSSQYHGSPAACPLLVVPCERPPAKWTCSKNAQSSVHCQGLIEQVSPATLRPRRPLFAACARSNRATGKAAAPRPSYCSLRCADHCIIADICRLAVLGLLMRCAGFMILKRSAVKVLAQDIAAVYELVL